MLPHYKKLMIIPVLLLVFSVAYLVNGYLDTGDWFLRGIDLKGGTVVSLPGPVDREALDAGLVEFNPRIRDVGGFGGEGVLIEVEAGFALEDILTAIQDSGIDTSSASIHTIGPALGENFWTQARAGISIAFVLMGIVVFFLFRKIVPSAAVIFAAVSDIIVTLAFMQVFGIQLSLAGLAAILMLIGYSVDTDILLTSRVLKEEEALTERIKGALKTGLTMSITTIGVLAVVVISGISPVITQIASVLLIGLVIDLANTWLMNAGLLRWHVERRGF